MEFTGIFAKDNIIFKKICSEMYFEKCSHFGRNCWHTIGILVVELRMVFGNWNLALVILFAAKVSLWTPLVTFQNLILSTS